MKKLVLCLLCMALIFTAACSAAPAAPPGASVTPAPPSLTTAAASPFPPPSVSGTPAPSTQQRLITTNIDSELLKDNLLNLSPRKTLVIYLPPSYYESDKAYPVVYYLHGHGEAPGMYIGQNRRELNDAFKAGAKEFIFVEIDGGTSYYVNSPVTGKWEDYFLDEVIPKIDKEYRTIPEASSRGISGFSMGGFGSINLAMRHPDVFCAVYSMSPGLLKQDGLPEAMETWRGDSGFLRDYARAFAPDTNAELLGDVPKLDGSDEDNIIVEKWMTGFGDLQEKLDAYTALGIPLKAIAFSYGTDDGYTWIPKGTQYFSELLKENGIENSLYTFEGGHTQPPGSMTELIVPFFNESLDYGDG